MSKFLFLLVGVVILSKTNGILITRKPSLTPEESDEEFSSDDWSELDVINPYSESNQFPEKRANRDVLMRRSTLDKNFMRFGRSGFFPGERCCKQKDLVGFAEGYSSSSNPTGTETDSNFMRFGRGDNNNFMRFGKRNGENFMRFGRADNDKGNFMRFGRGGSDNFMRFGKSDKDKGNFMRFGRDDKNNFMRFGRGGDDNFIRFGRGNEFIQSEQNILRSLKNNNFGRNPINFIRYGKSNGKEGFIRFGKRNKTNSLRYGLDSEEDSENEDGSINNLTIRRKRMISDEKNLHDRITRDPELMENVVPETKRSTIGENLTKPNLLKFISMINRNYPNWERVNVNSYFPPVQQNPVLKPIAEIHKRKQDGNGFIRFG